MTPCGSVPAMSPTFLRTWYQMSGTSAGGVESLRFTKIVARPALVKLLTESRLWRSLRVALQPVGDLLQGVVHRRPGPLRGHHHGLDREVGILAAAELE